MAESYLYGLEHATHDFSKERDYPRGVRGLEGDLRPWLLGEHPRR